jgi:hypothetical protein
VGAVAVAAGLPGGGLGDVSGRIFGSGRFRFLRVHGFPAGGTVTHNVAVTDRQSTDPCPQCRNTTAVHSIGELADMAKTRLNQPSAGYPAGSQPGYAPPQQAQPGYGGQPQPGYTQDPQPSYGAQPQPGYTQDPQPSYGSQPQPGYTQDPQPGWGSQPQPGYNSEPRPGGHTSGQRPSGRRPGFEDLLDPGRYARNLREGIADDIEGAIAGAALGAAAKFIGRRIGRKAQQAYTERVAPAMNAHQDAMLRDQVTIAERHPDVRACLTDNVIFLAGGTRTLPMPRLDTLTVEQADALVAQLRQY